MSDDREKLEVAKEVCGRLERENAELLTAITELRPDPVLVEGSFIPVADWPVILGNFMRGSAENARQAKAAHIQMIDFKAERDGLLATVETVREIASKRVRDPQLGFGGPPDDMPLEDDYVNFGEFYVAEEIRAALTTTPAQSLANLQAALVLEYIDSPEHAESLREAATIALEKAVARIGFARLIRMDRRSDEWWRGMNEAERLLLAVAAEYRKTTESETNHE